MTPFVPITARWTLALDTRAVAEGAPDRTRRVPLPPREVWSLLGTILATELVMLAVIVWYAATAG